VPFVDHREGMDASAHAMLGYRRAEGPPQPRMSTRRSERPLKLGRVVSRRMIDRGRWSYTFIQSSSVCHGTGLRLVSLDAPRQQGARSGQVQNVRSAAGLPNQQNERSGSACQSSYVLPHRC